MTAKRGLSYKDVCVLGVALPGVVESTSYGTPSLKVNNKFLLRLKEDGETLAMRTSFVVRDHLLRTAPDVFFITDHYKDYPAVLVRLARIDRETMRQLLEDAWRMNAPKKVVRAFDQDAESM